MNLTNLVSFFKCDEMLMLDFQKTLTNSMNFKIDQFSQTLGLFQANFDEFHQQMLAKFVNRLQIFI